MTAPMEGDMNTLIKIMDEIIDMTLDCLFMACILFVAVVSAVLLGA